jgi:hypothetical protein
MKIILYGLVSSLFLLSGCGGIRTLFTRDEIPHKTPQSREQLQTSTVTMTLEYFDDAGDLVKVFYSAQKGGQDSLPATARTRGNPTVQQASACHAGPEVRRWLSYLNYFESTDYMLCQKSTNTQSGRAYIAEARFDGEHVVILIEPTTPGLLSDREIFFLSYGFAVVKMTALELQQAVRQASEGLTSDWEQQLQQALAR